MKALYKVKAGENGVELREADKPVPKDNEILIRIHAAGICGTDIHIMKDEYPSCYPVIMGHEYSGTVEERGRGVADFFVGDRVVSITAAVTCGSCTYCRQGLLMLCENRLSIGSGIDGAFAEYMAIPSELAYKIPEAVSLEEAALCEPLACVVRAVNEQATVKAGDYVLVSGPGTIGLLALQAAVANGAKVAVAGTSVDKERMELALNLGASEAFTVEKDDIKELSGRFTGGCGFDVAFECAGVSASANMCIGLLKKTGHFAQVGLYGKKAEIDMDLLLKKEISISTSFASERTSWERALRLLEQKKVDVSPLISAKLPIERWKEGFEMAMNKKGFKILLTPNS